MPRVIPLQSADPEESGRRSLFLLFRVFLTIKGSHLIGKRSGAGDYFRLGAIRAASDAVVSGDGTPESTSPLAARWMAVRMRG